MNRIRLPFMRLLQVSLMFVFSVGCVSTHYDGDHRNNGGNTSVNGWAPDSGYVTVKMWNFTTNAWDTRATIPTQSSADFYYGTNDLFGWVWPIPATGTIPSRYKSGGSIRLQFSQGSTTFYVFDRALNTWDPSQVSPDLCIYDILDPFGTGGYTSPADYSANPNRVNVQTPFTRCGGSSLKALNLQL